MKQFVVRSAAGLAAGIAASFAMAQGPAPTELSTFPSTFEFKPPVLRYELHSSAPHHEAWPTGQWMSWRGMLPETTGFNGLPNMGIPLAKDRTHGSEPIDRKGFPLGLNLNMWPQQADFGPRTLDPASASWALLPPQSRGEPGQYLSRTTLAGVHDLLTGAPLIQEKDLELPFGGAMFRLIRTYSEPQSIWTTPYFREINQQYSVWDWVGTGWMINVSPVLLIDAAFSEVQGADATGTVGTNAYRSPVRRCWFVPDAHYSIAFDFAPDKPGASFNTGEEYEAPFNVDAKLTHNGTWDRTNHCWSPAPSVYTVHVMGGKVRYQVQAIRYAERGAFEDVPPVEYETGGNDVYGRPNVTTADSHEPPRFLAGNSQGSRRINNGYGIPGLGLTTRIEDDFGHRVEIELNRTLRETLLDNAATGEMAHELPNDNNEPARDRIEYAQNVNEKGQVRSVRLISTASDGTETVDWLLAFTYRNFYAWEYPFLAEMTVEQAVKRNPWQESGTLSNFLPTMLHAVHAYRNPSQTIVSQVMGRTTCTMDGRQFVEGQRSLRTVEDLQTPNIPSGWEHELRYFYNEVGKMTCLNPAGNAQPQGTGVNEWATFGKYTNNLGTLGLEGLDPDGDAPGMILRRLGHADNAAFHPLRASSQAGYGGALPGGSFSPVLLMTTRRSGVGTPKERDRNLYWYRAGGPIPSNISGATQYTENAAVRLAGVMRSESIRRALAGLTYLPTTFDDPLHPADLLELRLSDPIPWRDPSTSQTQSQPATALWQFADMLMSGRAVTADDGDLYNYLLGAYNDQFIQAFLGLPCAFNNQPAPSTGQRVLYYGNTEQGFDGLAVREQPGAPLRKYRMYSFLVPPSTVSLPDSSNIYNLPILSTDTQNYSAQKWLPYYPQDSIFHRPYKWTAYHLQSNDYPDGPAGNINYQWHATAATHHAETAPTVGDPVLHKLVEWDGEADLSKPTFVTVVDEINKDEGLESVGNGLQALSTLGASTWIKPRVDKRRVLWFNRAGYLIREKTFAADDHGVLQPAGQTGVGEEYVYDSKGRLIEQRGVAYGSSAELAGTATAPEGLIKVFKYPDNGSADVMRYAVAEGVQRGGKVWTAASGSTAESWDYSHTVWTHEMVRLSTDPTKITEDKVYPEGRPDTVLPTAVSSLVTTTTYTYQPVPRQRQLAWTKKVEPPQRVNDAVPAQLVYPVSIESFDDRGRSVWKGSGYSSSDTNPPGANDLFMWAYRTYDDRGREIVRISDVPDGSETILREGGGSVVVPADRPLSWPRRGGSTPAHLVTQSYYGYDRLSKVIKPTGLRDYYFYNEGYPEEVSRIYKDVQVGVSPSSFVAKALGQITTTSGGQVVEAHEVRWTALAVEPTGSEDFTQVRTITPRYDADGSVAGAKVEAPSHSPSVEALQLKDQLGLVVREQAPDGGLTRYVRDGWGRVSLTYKGTSDDGWTYAGPPSGSGTTNNMYLTERAVYGTGRATVGSSTVWTPDIGQTIASYSYRKQPTNSTQLDTYGRIERSEYDLASRKVVTSVSSADGPTAWTVQWLDLNERPRFTATFYGNRPTTVIGQANTIAGAPAISPLARFADPLPTGLAASILAAHPASLEEREYDARGNVTKVRQYRCGPTWTGVDYLETASYYDYMGRLAVQVTPGGGRQLTSYDDEGKPVVVSTYAGSVEQSRVETKYDNGNAVRTVTWERVRTTGNTLDSTNGVWSATYSWYDNKNRVIATADIGTGSPTDKYSNDSAVPDWSSSAPTWGSGAYQHTPDSTWTVNGVSATTFARYTLTEYNDQGKVTLSRSPLGIATRRFYNSFGSQILVVENADNTALQRRTAYDYDSTNRLVKVANVRAAYGAHASDGTVNWTSPHLEITELVYGADVVVPNGTVISRNNSVIGQVKLPKLSGTAAPVEYQFVYAVDGQLFSRRDRRQVGLEYGRDDLGRLTSVSVKGHPMIPPWGKAPEDSSDSLLYTYDLQGRLSTASLSTSNGTSIATDVITNTFTYDGWGNLTSEQSSMGSGSSPRTYTTGYTWDFATATAVNGNRNRLAGITYPAPPTTGNPYSQHALVLTLGYGAGGSAADQLGQMSSISDSVIGNLATFAWSGSGTRTGFDRPYGSGQLSQGHAVSTSGAPALDGFDRFGRETVLDFKSGATTSVQKHLYAFDRVGNILGERVELAGHANTLSQAVVYDALDRITQVRRGSLDLSTLVISGSSDLATPRTEAWQLDLLGNWSGAGTSPGYSVTGSAVGGGSGTVSSSLTHSVDARSQITGIQKVLSGTTTNKSLVYDRNGNLVSDGVHLYQYDPFNRLVQVNLLGGITFDADGEITGDHPGPWLVHYTYDALGRLARRQAPWVPVSQGGGTYDDNNQYIRIEEYAYDGLRRISEFFYDPMSVEINPKGLSSDIVIPTSGSAPVAWINRQYVYGPGDQHGLDEFVCEVDESQNVRLLVQDRSGDVTGVLDRYGGVLSQRQFDSTGATLLAENTYCWPVTRVGWQGLFCDRLDGTVFDQTVEVNADSVYQVRNRSYRPELGRFLQRDPNGGGQPTAASEAMLGANPAWYAASGFDSGAMYGDGLNLFAYGGGNSLSRHDPLGLDYWDDFNEGAGIAWQGVRTGMGVMDPSGLITDVLQALVEDYSLNQMYDLDWAMDWSQSDSDNSRMDDRWVAASMMRGAAGHYNLDYWLGNEPGSFTGPSVASATGDIVRAMGRTAGEVLSSLKGFRSKANWMIFESYSLATRVKSAAGIGSKLQAHHILPVSWARILGIADTNGIPSVLLKAAQHQEFTTELNRALKVVKAAKTATARQVVAIQHLRIIYKQHPELYEAISHLLR